jgi:hypothetical protein
MAQEKYGFFNSTAEDERSYDSADMATALRTLASSGVAEADTCLQVTAEGSTMRTLVGYGSAMLKGYYYQLRDDGSGIQAFTHTTEAELDRIDRIVLRLDFTARTISLIKLIGVAASTPEAPALTRNAESYELSLAQVLVQAAATEILPADITDERCDDDVCGLIAPESLRRSEIEQIIEDAIDDATEDVIRYSVQMLETAQQEQARKNIAAMQSIGTSTAIQKGNGNGDTVDAVPGTDFALPASEAAVTLAAAAWNGSAAPFTQTVPVSGMTADKKTVVGLAHSATNAQYLTAAEAMLHATAQGTGSITVTAEGKAPAIDLPILVQIVG